MSTSDDLGDLAGRTCLVTGAGRGVGRQICLHLAKHGAGGVVVDDFFLERAQSVAQEVSDLGCPALATQFDVSDFYAVRTAIERLRRTSRRSTCSSTTPATWDRTRTPWCTRTSGRPRRSCGGTGSGHLLGLNAAELVAVDNASASGSTAFRQAYLAVAEERCDIALAVGTGKMDRAMTVGASADPNEIRASLGAGLINVIHILGRTSS